MISASIFPDWLGDWTDRRWRRVLAAASPVVGTGLLLATATALWPIGLAVPASRSIERAGQDAGPPDATPLADDPLWTVRLQADNPLASEAVSAPPRSPTEPADWLRVLATVLEPSRRLVILQDPAGRLQFVTQGGPVRIGQESHLVSQIDRHEVRFDSGGTSRPVAVGDRWSVAGSVLGSTPPPGDETGPPRDAGFDQTMDAESWREEGDSMDDVKEMFDFDEPDFDESDPDDPFDGAVDLQAEMDFLNDY